VTASIAANNVKPVLPTALVSVDTATANKQFNRMDNLKKVSLSAAVIVLICFFLPWVQVSCGASKDSLSGVDLARDGHALLWLIPVLALAAVLVCFFGSWKGKLDFGALLGFVTGIISAYLMNRERMRADDASGLLSVRPTGWLWLGLVSSIVLAVISGIRFLNPPKPS